MQSSTNLKVRAHYEPSESEWELSSSLWRSPSSPPYTQTQSSNPKSGNSRASSQSTPSEFEFDSIRSLEIRDDPPASPKLISSFTTEYWSSAYSFASVRTTDGAEVSTSGAEVSLLGAGRTTTASAAAVTNHKVVPLSHPITSTKQPSTPPSPSVRQLMAEEMLGEHDDDDDDDGLALDFYSAPQTPTPTPPRKSSKQRPSSQDHEPSFDIAAHGGQRKSKSVVLERRAPLELLAAAAAAAQQKSQLLRSSKSESRGYFMSSATSSSAFAWDQERLNEEDKGVAGAKKKQGNSNKSFIKQKWAFKDILRRTVPSSKAEEEAHYRTRVTVDAEGASTASSSRNDLVLLYSSRESTPPTSHMHHHQHISSTPMSTPLQLAGGRPAPPSSTQSRTSTPAPSPPRSPMSPHAAHYQQRQKAQSQDLSRKTFLPYRQSLLACLGGPGAFPPEQHVW